MILDSDNTIENQVLDIPITPEFLEELGFCHHGHASYYTTSFSEWWTGFYKGLEIQFYTTSFKTKTCSVVLKMFLQRYKYRGRTDITVSGTDYPTTVKELLEYLDLQDKLQKAKKQKTVETN